MKRRHKAFLKINFISLIFVAVSFISVTLAWFAYSGLSSVETEVNVKAWYIELEKDGKSVSNDIVISLDDLYPGMDPVNELVKIKNKGDSDAEVKYSIVSARILDIPNNNYVVGDSITSEYVEDKLSHDYPFHININLSKRFVLSKTDESLFNVSISWPLDSGKDDIDSYWGTEAYKFQQSELALKASDTTYQIRPSIKVVISVSAEQYIESDISSDVNYNLGKEVLYDVVNDTFCEIAGDSCITTTVIDVDNKLHSNEIALLPSFNNELLSGEYSSYDTILSSEITGWKATTRPLTIEDVLKVVSTDITDSVLIGPNISNSIIGNLNYTGRITTELNKALALNGYYQFKDTFSYLASDNCYWIKSEYNDTNAFAVVNVPDNKVKAYSELKTKDCKVIPVIIAKKKTVQQIP